MQLDVFCSCSVYFTYVFIFLCEPMILLLSFIAVPTVCLKENRTIQMEFSSEAAFANTHPKVRFV